MQTSWNLPLIKTFQHPAKREVVDNQWIFIKCVELLVKNHFHEKKSIPIYLTVLTPNLCWMRSLYSVLLLHVQFQFTAEIHLVSALNSPQILLWADCQWRTSLSQSPSAALFGSRLCLTILSLVTRKVSPIDFCDFHSFI